ncbi:MAG: D-alanyl-D-alanine carboxypeptidase [Clostridia bacterium]|nr:D-alanyl-D-alanine carboxypeptidase [Clostridia bacterium]
METEAGEDAHELILAAGADEWAPAAKVPEGAESLTVGGKAAVLMDMGTGTVLYEHDADTPLPIASVTKIMTLLLIMEALDDGRLSEDDTVTCSATASSYGGSQIWLKEGETMTVHDLLKAITVVSANDACAAMAEHMSGSVESFVAAMNARAEQLGMENTDFHDCCGLDDTATSTARDVAIMSKELMSHPGITAYTTIWMDTLRGGQSQLVNTNKMVRFYNGATGLKTGTTATAGHCLSATAERDGLRLCAVILGCASTDERFGGARTMLDFGFANYAVYTPSVPAEKLSPVPVRHGVAREVQPEAAPMQRVLVRKGEETKITCEVTLAEDVTAPVRQGETVGQVTVTLDGKSLATYPITAKTAVPRLTVWLAFSRLWRALT